MRSISKLSRCRDRFGHWAEVEALELLFSTGHLDLATLNHEVCAHGHESWWRIMDCRCVFIVEQL